LHSRIAPGDDTAKPEPETVTLEPLLRPESGVTPRVAVAPATPV
jgi:hypothetical protein